MGAEFVLRISLSRLAAQLGIERTTLMRRMRRDAQYLHSLCTGDAQLIIKMSDLIPLESSSSENEMHSLCTGDAQVLHNYKEKETEKESSLNDVSSNSLKEKDKEKETIKETIKEVLRPDRKSYDWMEDGWSDVFQTWVQYKRGKGQTYKTEQSLKIAYNKLKKLSDNDLSVAKEIIENAIAMNYSGFFALKETAKPASKHEQLFKSGVLFRDTGMVYDEGW